MTNRYDEDLDPNQGPGFGCFIWQAILFAAILLLIPVGLFSFDWPVWLLATLLFIDLVLLFFLSMTSVFLLRVFFADRRGDHGRVRGVARQPTRVISTESADESPSRYAGRLGQASMTFDGAWVSEFLSRVGTQIEGFGDEEAKRVMESVASLGADETSRIEYELAYEGQIVPLRFEISMDDESSPDISVFTHPQLAQALMVEMETVGDKHEPTDE